MAAKRRFGRVRRLPSGRYQARYRGPDGIDRPAPRTFGTKSEAEVWLVKTEAGIRDEHWLNPDEGQIAFGKYARAWVEERPNLRPNTAQMYRYMLTRYLALGFGNRPVAEIREAHVRRRHLSSFTAPQNDALVFTSPTGALLHHSNFRQRSWLPALSKAGLTGTHFHDLRHTGNVLTAGTGATLRELMDRMGHSSTRAAMIYMHGSDARQHEIADTLSELAEQQLKTSAKAATGRPGGKRSGTQRARKGRRAS
jgi:hypothetical protein